MGTMFLKNSLRVFFLFLILFLGIFPFLKKENQYSKEENDLQMNVSSSFLEQVKIFDVFPIQKKNETYYYKVLDKYYTDHFVEPSTKDTTTYFTVPLKNSNLHLVVIATNTGKLIKK